MTCNVAFNEITIWRLKSRSNGNAHANRITWTLMGVFSLPSFFLLLIMPLMASLPCGFIAHWTVWPGQHRDTALMSFVVYYSLPPCLPRCPFSCKPEYCWQQISLPTARAVFSFSFSFLMLLKAVVRAGTSLHIQKVSLTCHFWSSACWVGVACHRALVSPQWLTTLSRKLPTDRCWLTNQQLSTTNLCCGPSRLTAFCVTVIELNRW